MGGQLGFEGFRENGRTCDQRLQTPVWRGWRQTGVDKGQKVTERAVGGGWWILFSFCFCFECGRCYLLFTSNTEGERAMPDGSELLEKSPRAGGGRLGPAQVCPEGRAEQTGGQVQVGGDALGDRGRSLPVSSASSVRWEARSWAKSEGRGGGLEVREGTPLPSVLRG